MGTKTPVKMINARLQHRGLWINGNKDTVPKSMGMTGINQWERIGTQKVDIIIPL